MLDSTISSGTATDKNGVFRFEKVAIGRHKLRITFIGYKEVLIPIEVTSGKEVVLRIELEEKVIVQTEAVATAGQKERQGQQ